MIKWVLCLCLLLSGKIYGESPNFSKDDKKRLALIVRNNHFLKPKINTNALTNQNTLNAYLKDIDPYSQFFSVREMRFKAKRNAKVRLGLGLDLLIENKHILGVPVRNGPAYQAGFRSPMYINTIANQNIDASNFETYSFLTGLSTKQTISVVTNTKDLTNNKSYSIKVDKFDRNLSYLTQFNEHSILTIREFSDETTENIKRHINSLKSNKPLIIDLRHNPGGDLYATIDTLSFFLKSNLTVAYLKEKGISIPLQTVSSKKTYKNKIIILLSSFTASSAEIFAQAIKHFLPETKLIGMPTSGKCLAQKTITMKDQSAIQLSAYQLLNAKKELCQNKPLAVDVKIANSEIKTLKEINTILSSKL